MIMLDEPSLGPAPLMVEQMYEALDGRRRTGLSILLVKQDVYMALDFASRAYVLENGTIAVRIWESDPPCARIPPAIQTGSGDRPCANCGPISPVAPRCPGPPVPEAAPEAGWCLQRS